uniref:Uncharacterized protein n=1 Tax=Anguilla anguilla TaxID=7936 RepID=A0A0E9QRG8_ANGAN
MEPKILGVSFKLVENYCTKFIAIH